jgi:hypothetical protein
MDKSGANYAGLATMIEICQVKYLNNIIGNYSAAENYRNITLRAVNYQRLGINRPTSPLV